MVGDNEIEKFISADISIRHEINEPIRHHRETQRLLKESLELYTTKQDKKVVPKFFFLGILSCMHTRYHHVGTFKFHRDNT